MKWIKIVVDKNGVQLDFNGFKGMECFKERDKIAEILLRKYGVALNVIYEEKKPEAEVEAEQSQAVW